ncbi:hypothetical protein IAD21_05989 [Abditibacteriota bacterium]|nr:hypothetical protein IAD21_05989 [Abditibacteriota bacterium]
MLSRVWLLAFIVTCLCGFPLVSRAQTPTPTPAPLQMVLSSPFATTVKPLAVSGRAGKWVPLAVTLSNTGEPVSGQVQLQLAPLQGGTATLQYASNTYTADVELPTNSSKRIWLYARIDRADVGGFDVSFSGRGFRELAQRVPVASPDSEQREVMVVSDTDIGLNDTLRALRSQALFRAGKAPTNNFTTGLTPIKPFSFSKDLVPDRWIGFESADMVVLGDFPHIALSPTQIDALRGYVQGGGTLVILGGANAARLSSSPLKDLWPLIPSNSVSASSGEVAELVSKYVDNPQNGGDRLGGAPVVVTRGTLTPDAILRDGTSSSPLFSQRDSGAGRVLFLSYDPSQPPFKGWSGQGKLWRDLFVQSSKLKTLDMVDDSILTASYSNFGGGGNPYPPTPYYGGDDNASSSLTDKLLQTLSHAQQLTMPPVSRIAWFLALYVFFLVPLNYAVLRIIDRRELAWVTIPVIVVVFSVWAYTEALSIRGRAILTRQMDVVQSSIGSKAGRVDSLFWLFSPRRTTYEISTAGLNAALCDYANSAGGEQGEFSITQPLDGGSFKIDGAPVRMWTDRAFASQSLGNLGQGLSLNGNTLHNGLGVDLYGLVWVQDGRVTGLGALQNGDSVSLASSKNKSQKFGADILGGIERASQLNAVFDQSARANNIPQAALAAALGSGFGKYNSTPMLLAWGKRSVAPFSIGVDNGQGRQMTLFIFRAPKLPAQLAASEATVQRVAFEPFAPGQSPIQGGFAFFDCDKVPISDSLVMRVRGTGISQYSAQMYSSRSRFDALGKVSLKQMVHFDAWNVQNARWQPVTGVMRTDSSPAGGWVFSASVPRAWIRRPDNSLRVRVRLANAGAQVSSLHVSE